MGSWPDYIGVCDASSHGVGGVIVGKNNDFVPIVFRWEWPQDVKESYTSKVITNSNLEMAGLICLYLVMELVCGNLQEKGLHCSVTTHQELDGFAV